MFFLLSSSKAWAGQYECSLYAQNPQQIQVNKGQTIDREVEIVYTNTGQSTWQNYGGVVNGNYIELRAVNSSGQEIEGPLYHSSWINRKRVGSYLATQGNVITTHRARFVFRIRLDTSQLSPGTHNYYFRPYHALGHWINNWGNCNISVEVLGTSQPPTTQPTPVATIHGASMNPAIAGTLVTIQGSATNNPVEYQWQVNGTTVSNQTSFEHVFSAGSNQVSLRARNTYGWGQQQYYTLTATSASTPSSAQASIDQIRIERTNPNTGRAENYDLITQGTTKIRQYRTMQLRGSGSGSQVAGYEWSIHQNGKVKVVSNQANYTTKPDEIVHGNAEVALRVLDPLGQWSDYTKFAIEVEFWPRIRYPVTGQWQRSGNNYFQGDHTSHTAQYAEDYNQASGSASADFARDIVAVLNGTAEIKTDTLGGRIVDIISEDTRIGIKFRSRYMHLSSVLVQEGERVFQGQPIGLCGNTGSSSTASHLHYVLQLWQNGRWESVIPEPIWVDTNTVNQVTSYGTSINSQASRTPDWMIVLPETYAGQGNQDSNGWGQSKVWSSTIASTTPTVNLYWDATIPEAGTWQLTMHNPSGNTQNLAGVSTHNTSSRAVFEIMRTGAAGYETFTVDQAGSVKGGLVEIMQFQASAGDRIMITQHNATGESNREVSFDQLVLKLVSALDGGGQGIGQDLGEDNLPPPSIEDQAPSPNQQLTTATPNPNTTPNAGAGGGGGGGSGGCHLSTTPSQNSLWSILILLGCIVLRRKLG